MLPGTQPAQMAFSLLIAHPDPTPVYLYPVPINMTLLNQICGKIMLAAYTISAMSVCLCIPDPKHIAPESRIT